MCVWGWMFGVDVHSSGDEGLGERRGGRGLRLTTVEGREAELARQQQPPPPPPSMSSFQNRIPNFKI